MRICPTCEQTFDDETKFCPDDGTPLKAQEQSQDPMMGRRLMDRWEVIDRIGAGGFGTVYKVRDLRFDYVEALKVFDRRRLNPEEVDEAVARFRREAMLLKRLGNLSQNIVGVSNMEDDEEGGFIYFTMEHVAGENISQILVREGALAPDRVVAITKQICKALSVAHNYEEGIVHRDMKLENVMITRDKNDQEVVKILDFGIAKAIGQQSLTNLNMGGPGTPGYAAPEQVEGREIDQRTDLFALGVVIYGMLTGREPWLGGFITEPSSGGWTLLKQTVDGDPIPAHRWDPEIPKALEDIVFKLLEKSPDDRFQSAEEVMEALEAFESGKAVPVPTRGTLRVLSQEPGVAIRVKQGVFKTVAEGRTPWEAETLEPGSYTIQVRDDRYEKESRDVEVVAEGTVEITLTAARLEDTRERPGSLTVETQEEGVRVRLRDGFRSMGEGTTPWAASSLPPGDYKIEVVDDRYARTSRSVRILPEEETSIRISVQDKSDVPLWKRVAQNPIPLGIAALGVAVSLYFVSTRGAGTRMDFEDFAAEYLEGNPDAILQYRVAGDELRPTVITDEGDLPLVVPLDGVPLQQTMRRLGETQGSAIIRGSGSVVFEPLFGDSPLQAPARFTLRSQSGEEVCTDCVAGEPIEDLPSGWFEVDQGSDEWLTDSVTVADRGDVYAEEPVTDRLVFVPDQGSIALRFALVPTELGRTLGQAQAELRTGTRESLAEALNWVEQALETHPENPTGLEIRNAVASGYVELGRTALRGGDITTAGTLARECATVPGGERPECDTLLQEAQTQLQTQLAQAEAAQAEADAEAARASGEAAPAPTGEVTATTSPVERLATQASQALASNNLDAARQAVEQCLIFDAGAAQCVQLEGRIAGAYLTRARQRLQAGQLADAESAVGQCLNLESSNADCRQVRGSIALRRGQQAVQSGDLTQAWNLAQACQRDARGNTPDCGDLVDDIAGAYFAQARTAFENDRLPAARQALDQCSRVDSGNADCGRVGQAINDLTSAQRELQEGRLDGARRLAQQCLNRFSDADPCSAVIDRVQTLEAQATAAAERRAAAQREPAAATPQPEPARPEPARPAEPTPSGPTVSSLSVNFAESSNTKNVRILPSFDVAGATGRFCAAFRFVAPQGYTAEIRHEFSAGAAPFNPLEIEIDPMADETYLPKDGTAGEFRWDVTAWVYGQGCAQAPTGGGGSPLATWSGQACWIRTMAGDWFSGCGG